MGLFSFFSERRSAASGFHTPSSDPVTWFTNLFGGISSTGEQVNEDTSLSFSAVWACVQVRAESLAQLPIGIFERVDNGKVSRTDHDVYYLLHNEPNSKMTAFTFFKTMQAMLDLYGNAYAEIIREKNSITGFEIIHPDKIQIRVSPRGLVFYDVVGDTPKTVKMYDMIHLVGLSNDGIVGKSPISAHREAVGLALATQKFGAKFYSNGATLSGILEHPGKLTPDAKQRLEKSWSKKYEGQSNAFKTAILEEGMKYSQIGIKPVDAQYIEMMRFNVEEIARIYRVPLHLIGDLTRSTNNNIEEQGISFVRDTMTPIAKIWEQELSRKVFTVDEKRRMFVEFNMNGLLRGNAQARAQFYMTMVQNGLMNPNEVRNYENLNAYDGGDKFMKPLNMGYVDDNDNTETDGEEGNT